MNLFKRIEKFFYPKHVRQDEQFFKEIDEYGYVQYPNGVIIVNVPFHPINDCCQYIDKERCTFYPHCSGPGGTCGGKMPPGYVKR